MKLFVDASAMVSMIALESDFRVLTRRLDLFETRCTSAMALWEAAVALARLMNNGSVERSARELADFVQARSIGQVNIGAVEGRLAIEAYGRFGKGRHPAGLNFGDCFAYACAKANNARLLYKGDDFSQTDLAWPADA